jgi:hypothetical protein
MWMEAIVDWTSGFLPRLYAFASIVACWGDCDPERHLHTPAIRATLVEVEELTLVKASASRPSKEDPIMTKRICMALMATLLSLSAMDSAQAGPRRDDDTNRHTNKSTGG